MYVFQLKNCYLPAGFEHRHSRLAVSPDVITDALSFRPRLDLSCWLTYISRIVRFVANPQINYNIQTYAHLNVPNVFG